MRIPSVLVFGASLLAHTAHAQHLAGTPTSVSIAYSTVRANSGPGQCGCFYLNGGSVEFALPLHDHASLIGDLGGETTASVNGNVNGLSLITYTAGPRVSVSRKRMEPFAQALIGGAHGFNSFFPANGHSTSSSNSLAVLLGGGLDLSVAQRLSINVFQADYLLTRFTNGSNNQQNNLRLSGGIKLRFGGGNSHY